MTDSEMLQQILTKINTIEDTVRKTDSRMDSLESSLAEVKAGQAIMQDSIVSMQKDIKTIKADVKKLQFGESVFQPWVDKIELRLKKVESIVGIPSKLDQLDDIAL